MTHTHRTCQDFQAKGDVPIASLNPDSVEYGFLSAARYFFLSFSDQNASSWLTAILEAPSFFGGHHPAETMRLALSIVHEMRTSRKSMFRFSNPRCQRCSAMVTQDERFLLQIIQAARKGKASDMTSAALLLCEGEDYGALISAAKAFAQHTVSDAERAALAP